MHLCEHEEIDSYDFPVAIFHNVLTLSTREINKCLLTLGRMEKKWHGASRCHKALSTFISRFEKTSTSDGNSDVHSSLKRPRPTTTTSSHTPRPKRSRLDSSDGVGVVNNTFDTSWPSEEPRLHDSMLPALQDAPGDIFQNICWDGDFSSLDQFMTDEDRLQWLA